MARRAVLTVAAVAGVAGVVTFAVLLGGVLVLTDPPRDEWGYVGGKDSVDAFGGGRWEVVKAGSRSTGDRLLFLTDRKTHETVVWDVTDWRKVANRACLLDREGRYTVLTLDTGEVLRYGRLEDAPEADRWVLSDLKPR